jgi:oxygen-independent coproporphyrinogen-3 oxidase
MACQRLAAAGIEQYEISNFARAGRESRHNLKYWTLQPYIGFGVDAHSMLPATERNSAVRFSNPDSLEKYLQGGGRERTFVTPESALEEHFFVGLRLTRGVDLNVIADQFGAEALQPFSDRLSELADAGLITREASVVRLTPTGRLLSNEVFQRFISVASESVASEV